MLRKEHLLALPRHCPVCERAKGVVLGRKPQLSAHNLCIDKQRHGKLSLHQFDCIWAPRKWSRRRTRTGGNILPGVLHWVVGGAPDPHQGNGAWRGGAPFIHPAPFKQA